MAIECSLCGRGKSFDNGLRGLAKIDVGQFAFFLAGFDAGHIQQIADELSHAFEPHKTAAEHLVIRLPDRRRPSGL